jgi:hypothetical protein
MGLPRPGAGTPVHDYLSAYPEVLRVIGILVVNSSRIGELARLGL